MLPIYVQITEDIKMEYSTAEIFEICSKEDNITLKLAIEQPEDVMVIQTFLKPIDSQDYEVEMLEENRYKIKSKLHGYINDYLEVKFSFQLKFI